MAKGKGSRKAQNGVGRRGTWGSERKIIVARAGKIFSSDLI